MADMVLGAGDRKTNRHTSYPRGTHSSVRNTVSIMREKNRKRNAMMNIYYVPGAF